MPRGIQWIPKKGLLYSYLVRKDKRELDLVRHGLGVAPALDGDAECRRASPQGRASKAKRIHLLAMGREGEEW